MTVLLTNDDGVQSPGLAVIRDALIAAGHRVITVAPDSPRSGTARSATFRRAVNVDRVGGDDDDPIYACDGTPVDCVRVGLLSHLAHDVDLLVSGVNEGANVGDDATYSSTVGAALEGALLGVPSISTSQQSSDGRFRLVDKSGYDWTWGVRATLELVGLVLAEGLPQRSAVSLNAPATDVAPGVACTQLGRRAWRRGGLELEHTDDFGHGYYSFEVNSDADPHFIADPGTDFAALLGGDISLTPMSLDWGVPDTYRRLRSWTQSAASRIASALAAQEVT